MRLAQSNAASEQPCRAPSMSAVSHKGTKRTHVDAIKVEALLWFKGESHANSAHKRNPQWQRSIRQYEAVCKEAMAKYCHGQTLSPCCNHRGHFEISSKLKINKNLCTHYLRNEQCVNSPGGENVRMFWVSFGRNGVHRHVWGRREESFLISVKHNWNKRSVCFFFISCTRPK